MTLKDMGSNPRSTTAGYARSEKKKNHGILPSVSLLDPCETTMIDSHICENSKWNNLYRSKSLGILKLLMVENLRPVGQILGMGVWEWGSRWFHYTKQLCFVLLVQRDHSPACCRLYHSCYLPSAERCLRLAAEGGCICTLQELRSSSVIHPCLVLAGTVVSRSWWETYKQLHLHVWEKSLPCTAHFSQPLGYKCKGNPTESTTRQSLCQREG